MICTDTIMLVPRYWQAPTVLVLVPVSPQTGSKSGLVHLAPARDILPHKRASLWTAASMHLGWEP